jgi:PBP1b-binding outer membrane lipoprotein LpoB
VGKKMVVKKRYLILPVILGGTLFFAGCSPYQDAMELEPKEEVVKEKEMGSALSVDGNYKGIKNDEHVFMLHVKNESKKEETLTANSGSMVSLVVKNDSGEVVYDSKQETMDTQAITKEDLPPNTTVIYDARIKRGAVEAGTYNVTLTTSLVDKSQNEPLEVELTDINLD